MYIIVNYIYVDKLYMLNKINSAFYKERSLFLPNLPQQLFIQMLLIMINAFFAASEIAVISLNHNRLRKLSEKGDRTAPKLLKLIEQPSDFLSTIQIGITLAGFLGSAFAAESFSEYLVTFVYYDLNFTFIPTNILDTISVILITIILSYFTLVFGELVPKRIAMQKPLEVAKISCNIISVISVVMHPIILFLSASTNLILRIMRLKTETGENGVTEEEIRMMIEIGSEKGTINEDEQEWIENVFEFGDTSVRDAMTLEMDAVAFPIDAPDEQILQTIQKTGLSRYPVYKEDINNILGILNARDFLINQINKKPKPLEDLLRPAYFVPESIHTDQLFKDMQKKKVHISIVIDEYGETSGIITMEDLLEEIVGNIYDEFDPAEKPEIEKLEPNLWRVSGSLDIETLAEELDVSIPETDDYDTVGGMVISCLHTIPKDGTVLDVTVNGLSIHVEKIADRRIQQTLIKRMMDTE